MQFQREAGFFRSDTVSNSDLALVVVLKGTQSSPLPVVVSGGGGGTTANVTRVSVNVAAVTLLASNANRVSAFITNYSATATLYVKAGAGPVITPGAESFTGVVKPGQSKFFKTDLHEYSGIITGIWDIADASGAALVTEVLP